MDCNPSSSKHSGYYFIISTTHNFGVLKKNALFSKPRPQHKPARPLAVLEKRPQPLLCSLGQGSMWDTDMTDQGARMWGELSHDEALRIVTQLSLESAERHFESIVEIQFCQMNASF